MATHHEVVLRDGRELWIRLPMAGRGQVSSATAWVALRQDADETIVPAELRVRGGGLMLTATPGRSVAGRHGAFTVVARIAADQELEVRVGVGRPRLGGRFVMEGASRVGVVRNARSVSREFARSMYMALPLAARRTLGRVARRLRRMSRVDRRH